MTKAFPVKHRTLGIRYATIDDDDYPTIKNYRWKLFKRRKVHYLRALIDGKQILLHRLIMGVNDAMTVDHIDGDPLNNTRANLKVCTNAENVKAGWRRGAYAVHSANKTYSNTVKKRLADGSIKTYKYDRRNHSPWGKKRTETSN